MEDPATAVAGREQGDAAPDQWGLVPASAWGRGPPHGHKEWATKQPTAGEARPEPANQMYVDVCRSDGVKPLCAASFLVRDPGGGRCSGHGQRRIRDTIDG